MGMTFKAVAVSPDELDRLIVDPDGAAEVVYDDARTPSVDLDKAWHGLHYLLTGSASDGAPPYSLAVMGGDELPRAAGRGPEFVYLTADRVAVVAEHLADLTREQLAARYDPAAMDQAYIYPELIWERDGQQALDYLLAYFDKLKAFYRHAAAGGLCVVKVVG